MTGIAWLTCRHCKECVGAIIDTMSEDRTTLVCHCPRCQQRYQMTKRSGCDAYDVQRVDEMEKCRA